MQQSNDELNLLNKKHLVLVVDDEMINREILSQILSNDYKVITASDGTKALAAIRDRRKELSLILLDLLMPGIHGLDLLQMIKGNTEMKQIPVIVATSDHASEVKSLQLGASDFISKPYPAPSVILARVQRIIELYDDQKLIQSTEKDSVTGLYTRQYFFRYAEDFARSNREVPMDAILLNINHFHIINERYGKKYGNTILKQLADKIRSAVKKANGLVCRPEADTFLVFCRHGLDYNALMEQVSINLDAEESGGHIRLRMGVYPDVDKELDIERCFDRAKMAADTNRNTYEQTISFYDSKLHEGQKEADRLLNEFENALAQRQFQVYYQPKFNIEKDVPVLASAEALVRWKHPELGMISPGKFIPLFEENGLIRQLDHYVWREVAAQIRRWKDRFGYAVPVSVNVSRVDMFDPNLVENFKALIDEHGLSTSEYLLEITESAYTSDSAQIIEKVRRLRKLGFRIEMDDFGSGYSSLNMLSTLPIDALKLDMKFIKTAFSGRKDTRMIELIIDIARYLSVPVIAEGVESKEQVEALKELGCQIIQGFYFSRPVPPEEFEPFIIQQKPVKEQEAAAVQATAATVSDEGKAEIVGAMVPRENVHKEPDYFYYIAKALSSDFESVYYVDMDTEEYTEFLAKDSYEKLQIELSGYNFFAECAKNLKAVVYPEDMEKVGKILRKDELTEALNEDPVYTLDYRLMVNGQPTYYRMKIVRPEEKEDHHLVIGVSNINSQIVHQLAQQKKLDREHHDSLVYARIAQALAKDFFIIYYVNIDTDGFLEFSSSERYNELQIETNGVDFFESCIHNVPIAVHEEDVDKVLYVVNKENMLRELEKHGSISTSYRMILSGESVYVNMKAILMDGQDGGNRHVVVAVSNIDAQMKREQEFAEAQAIAMKDSLTRVKNKRAYAKAEKEMNVSIGKGETGHFAVVMCHAAGPDWQAPDDRQIVEACELVCDIFRHSPVYRIGNEDFAVLLRDRDYRNREKIFQIFQNGVDRLKDAGGPIVVSGLSEFDAGLDKNLNSVMERAGIAMYENKLRLKKH